MGLHTFDAFISPVKYFMWDRLEGICVLSQTAIHLFEGFEKIKSLMAFLCSLSMVVFLICTRPQSASAPFDESESASADSLRANALTCTHFALT